MPDRAYRTSIYIDAPPSTVYPYLTEAESIRRWMGDHVVTDARPGGEFTADINGLPVRGEFVELDPPHRVVISWGHAGSEVLPPGSSVVEITLQAITGGTRVNLEHRRLPQEQLGLHAMGWDHYLPRLQAAGAGGEPGTDYWSIEAPFIPESQRTWEPISSD